MNRNISALTQCANCGSCYNACPVDAICIDGDGYFYKPVVEESRCIQCGKCLQVCPLKSGPEQTAVLQALWGWHNDRETVKKSSSGGAFTAMAEKILADGGVVFAACLDAQMQVRICSSDSVPLEAFRKSKYVESLTGDSFRQAERQLRSGRKVLFCGSPCQIAGLKSYLGKDYETLYTCDFSCGGFSSHQIFRQYLQMLEKEYRAAVESVDFRPKVYGWSTHAIRIRFANGKTYTNTGIADPYFYGFLYYPVNKREYCYDCKFAKEHASDIILADFWKYGKLIGGKLPERGVSLILATTEKGKQLLQGLEDTMTLKKIDPVQASYNLRERHRDEALMEKRERFLRSCSADGLRTAAEQLGMPSGARAVVYRLKHAAKGILLHLL